jgi:hypothetical protein
MSAHWTAIVTGAALFSCASFSAYCAGSETGIAIGPKEIAKIIPGKSTKADIQSSLGPPWRVVQFNDCGMAMDDQADETWEYRGSDPDGGFRVHLEFDDNGIVHPVARIPDKLSGGAATIARISPGKSTKGMSM